MKTLFEVLGITRTPVSHTEKIVSALGGFTGIFFIFIISRHFVGEHAAGLIVASMGASAVLLFAVPHGPLSQPWSVFGGHLISAVIGVSCAKLIPNEFLAGSVAVGAAIGAMYYLRCIHPPGGATAISAVISGPAVHELGYQYVITPILLNVMVILAVALLFNYLFSWRRYPAYFHRQAAQPKAETPQADVPHIAHEDFVYALSEIGSFIDIDEYDLLRIYDLATRKSLDHHTKSDDLEPGAFYSNGEDGEDWSVRQVVDESRHPDAGRDTVVFKVADGLHRHSSGYCTRQDFLKWANHRVVRDEDNWKRVEEPE